MKITGIILAGGKSSRMGSDKAFLKLAGKELIDFSLEILEKTCDEIIISSNKTVDKKIRVIHDEIKGIGPAGGIYSCLKQSSYDLNIVLSCDMPLIREQTIKKLIGEINDKLVTVPTLDGKNLEPLCAIYHKESLPYFEKKIGKGMYKMQEIIGGIPSNIIDLSSIRDQFLNINNPNDFQKASQQFQSLSS